MQAGALYIGTGKEFLKQAITSAKSLQDVSDLPIGVVTSHELEDIAKSHDCFNDVIVLDSAEDCLQDKVKGMEYSPYDETIYLDTDTIILEDPSPALELMEKFDLAASHAPERRSVTIETVPEAYPEYNTGVLVFKHTPEVETMFQRWATLHQDQIDNGRPEETVLFPNCDILEDLVFGREHGQPPFRQAVYESNLNVTTLPREYNFRGSVAYAQEPVKVLHMGHSKRRFELANVINSSRSPRAYVSGRQSIYYGNGDVQPLDFARLEYLAKKLGLVDILDTVGAKSVVKSILFKSR